MIARLNGVRAPHFARGFGIRLGLALVITLAAVGGIGYSLTADQLRSEQIANYKSVVQADGASFEALSRTSQTPARAVREINQLLNAVGDRTGVIEARLIDQRRVVVATGARNNAIGYTDSDPRIGAALLHGTSYAGGETDPRRGSKNFEFVIPVQLPGGRYALEVGYDSQFLDSSLAALRSTLALVGLLALMVGGLVFYLVGGRSLMRSHRIALLRAMRDGLTDMPNHRAFQEDLEQAVSSARRHDAHLTLVVLDVDDFKRLNDRHGTAQGDAILKRVAAILCAGRR